MNNEAQTAQPQIWRLHLKSDAEQGIDPGEFCTKENIAGIGWPVEPDADNMAWEDYYRLAKKKYHSDKGWWAAINAVKNRMAVGDLCWTRTQSGKYWLGRIAGDWAYRNGPQNMSADGVNVRQCIWHQVGDLNEVPGTVRNAFIRGQTLRTIPHDTIIWFSMDLFNRLSGTSSYNLPKIEMDLLSLLDSDACEDLVGIYLQMQGWILFPSTSKTGTPNYEFTMRNRATGEMGAVQVKQGKQELVISDYEQFDGKVFLFQTERNYIGSPKKDTTTLLEPALMKQFCRENVDKMPTPIQRWVEWGNKK